MKKQLLTFAVAVMTSLASMAQTVAFVAEGASYTGTGTTQSISGNLAGNSYTEGDIKIEFVKVNSSTSQVNTKVFRWYANDKIVVTPLNGKVITEVSFLGITASYQNVELTCDNGTVTTGATRTWTGDSSNALTFTAGKQIRFSVLEITYKDPAPSAVEKPVIVIEDDYATITCATEGADIYYTLDGTEPTAASAKYTEPIKLNSGKYTIMAIAIKDDDSSIVAAESVNIPIKIESLASLVGLHEGEVGTGIDFEFTGTLTYVYQANTYLYLTDGTDNVKLFGYSMPTYVAGETFNSLKGTYAFRYGQPQISNFVISSAVAGGKVILPVEIEDAAMISAANDNKWYTIKGVEIKGVNGKNATMVAGDTEVTLYNDLDCDGFANGTNLTVSGIVGLYNSTVQFLPTEITSASGLEIVAIPVFSHEDGAYPENTEITLSCATEGATIVYTVNDGEALESDEEVVLTLTEDMTITAYATKEGMEDSQTVTGTFTVKQPQPIEGTTAVFDFSEEGFANIECDPAQSTYPGANLSPADEYVFTVNGVSLSFEKGDNKNNTAGLFKSDYTLRMYVDNTMTVSIEPGYKLKQIAFTFAGNSYKKLALADNQPGIFDNDIWTAAAASEPAEVLSRADDSINSVTFIGTGTNRITGMNVDFEKISTGIDSVDVDANAPAVYYNLQGIRIANPTQGQIVIRRQGNTIDKVIF